MTKEAPFALATINLDVISRHGVATLACARQMAREEAQARGAEVVLVWGSGSLNKKAPEYVEPNGRVSTLHNHDGKAGCVDQWVSRDTGTLVGLYHGPQAGMEVDPSALWCTVCEAHGTLVGHATLKDARRTRSPKEFCDDCRGGEPT